MCLEKGGKMAEEKKDKLESEKFRKVFRVLADVIFVPFIIIILISSILMFKSKINNEVPSLFGYSAVKILSNSMEPNYHEGQVVLIKKVDPKKLNVGDVIAFYQYMDINDEENSKDYSVVIFHRIVDKTEILNSEDENYGKIFFQTQGDNNTYVDEHWVMEDYVVGVLSSDNSFVSNFFNFCTSTGGIILLIIIPCLAIIVIVTINLINEAKRYKEIKDFEKQTSALQKDLMENQKQKDINKEEVLASAKEKNENELRKNLEDKSKTQSLKEEQNVETKHTVETKQKKIPEKKEPNKTKAESNLKDVNQELKKPLPSNKPLQKDNVLKQPLKKPPVPPKQTMKSDDVKMEKNNKTQPQNLQKSKKDLPPKR